MPIMSPTRPRIGVATDADSSQAIRTQDTAACVVCNSSWMTGRAGLIRDCSIANDPVLTASNAKMTAADERRVTVEDMRELSLLGGWR